MDDFEEANDTLWLEKATTQQRAQQQCLGTWFNLMWGEVGWFSTVDGQYSYQLWDTIQDAYDAGDHATAHAACDTFNNIAE